ncbi:MAG: nicotinate phosphoribosyltransferase [Candidatus Methanomethylophilaceae archaeon]|nr:nicotinate phosphoribosyltransferase [Candidatus Methanomethylophilaceae archaeon]
MTQCDKRNLSMVMDLYEMTMANGYFIEGDSDKKAVFDVFYRKNPDNGGFAVFAGLEQAVEMIAGLHFDDSDIDYFRSLGIFGEEFLEMLSGFRFRGDVYAFPEGSVVYPNEPLVTVVAPIIDAQLIETALLAQINHQSLIATKTSRIVRAAKGRSVSDFGARRAHNMDAAVYGARAAYIGGATGTATVLAGKEFGVPVSGTMAHSWVMYYGDEFEAFRKYAETYPDNALLLVDTYDALHSGVPNAIRCAKEVLEPMGKRLKGIRFDSGDLAYLSKKARAMLDAAGLNDCKIVVSNSLDEYTIGSILDQGGMIDGFGVGERLITAKSDPVFGGVYKIAAVEENGSFSPRIKISESVEKITNPGWKDVYRVYSEDGHAVADLLTIHGEEADISEGYGFVDPKRPWKSMRFGKVTAKKMHEKVIENGRIVCKSRGMMEMRDYLADQLKNEIWPEEQRFSNPHEHFLDMSPGYYRMKMDLLDPSKRLRSAHQDLGREAQIQNALENGPYVERVLPLGLRIHQAAFPALAHVPGMVGQHHVAAGALGHADIILRRAFALVHRPQIRRDHLPGGIARFRDRILGYPALLDVR